MNAPAGRSRRPLLALLMLVGVAALVIWLLDIDLFGGGGGGAEGDGEGGSVQPLTGPAAAPAGPFIIEMRGSGAYVDGQGPIERVELVELARTANRAGRPVQLAITASALEPDVAASSDALSAAGVPFDITRGR